MAPRRRRSKVGLTRMHAALDAMRPMGFSTDIVRKCVKNLLKVYGDDGWAFIEEAAYKLLIDTILEGPDVDQLEHEPEHPPLESGSHGSYEQPESVHELCGKEIILEEKVCAPDTHEPETNGKAIDIKQESASDIQEPQTRCEVINIKQEKSQEQDLDVKVTPMLLQDANTQREVGVQLGFALAYAHQSSDSIPTNQRGKPCYGWISDDEDDDFVQLTPANSKLTAANSIDNVS